MNTMIVETKSFPQGRFSERDLSWLSFNERVLDLAQDPNIPILERARFLAIFVSNLDEFFKVRIAGSKRRIEAGIAVRSAGGMLPRELLGSVLSESYRLQKKHSEIFEKDVRPLLADKDIRIIRWNELFEDEKKNLGTLFIEKIFPVLTPLAVDPAHPFPYISGLSLNLAVVINSPKNDTELFARVKVPPTFPRLINSQGQRFVPLEDVISAHLDLLFPGMKIVQHHTFRVTRNEDVEVEEDDAENLLDALERELTKRKFGAVVRLEVEEDIDEHVLELLVEELEASENEVFRLPGLLDLRGLNDICNLNRDDLKFAKFIPRTNPQLAIVESASAPDVFEALKTRDILLHHPYDSFSTSVQRFLEQASTDPKVLAIKQTLYRTSGDSPIVSSLIEAAHNGKQVLAIVEIKARFDEQANISWARKLEEAGVHVVYGVVGLKTHAKLSLVVRQENEKIKRYGHLGTGNYNPKTARGYEDLGLLTANPQITNDIAYLFNLLSGYSTNNEYDKLLVAPHSVRDGIIKRIKREIDNSKSGKPSGIRFKCNSIVDEQTIDALYEASSYGVKVDLVIRGMCALKPGVPGLSENITVRSILGRFLEHSRIYEFTNGGSKEVWIGSADLMHRNLDRRVEALVQLEDTEHVSYLSELLDLYINSETAHWLLDKNGGWMRRSLDAFGNFLQDAQEQLIKRKNLRGLD
ncbi:MAG: RNA degradosome polyphosphate kinase [Candidatus Nanopelagicales bacterium]|nr:RNA degradosome polyphosphate kinase [Candidatus Nanopelagicales bacterium]